MTSTFDFDLASISNLRFALILGLARSQRDHDRPTRLEVARALKLAAQRDARIGPQTHKNRGTRTAAHRLEPMTGPNTTSLSFGGLVEAHTTTTTTTTTAKTSERAASHDERTNERTRAAMLRFASRWRWRWLQHVAGNKCCQSCCLALHMRCEINVEVSLGYDLCYMGRSF